MARQRKMPQPQVPLPEGDKEVQEIDEIDPEEQPIGWQRAYERAILKGCSPKAARIYAEAHGEEFEDAPAVPVQKELSREELEAEITRLEALRDAAST